MTASRCIGYLHVITNDLMSSVLDCGDIKVLFGLANKLSRGHVLILSCSAKVADVVMCIVGFLAAGEKRVAVPMAELKRCKNDHFVLAATKDSLKQMAIFELKTASTAGSGSSAHK